MRVIFISGQYRANSEYKIVQNIRHAEEAMIKLVKEGWAVICPHRNSGYLGGVLDNDGWAKIYLELLKRSDAIYLLRDWQDSEGAREEFLCAVAWGKEVIYE